MLLWKVHCRVRSQCLSALGVSRTTCFHFSLWTLYRRAHLSSALLCHLHFHYTLSPISPSRPPASGTLPGTLVSYFDPTFRCRDYPCVSVSSIMSPNPGVTLRPTLTVPNDAKTSLKYRTWTFRRLAKSMLTPNPRSRGGLQRGHIRMGSEGINPEV